jgi:prolyl-tRNA synthetase
MKYSILFGKTQKEVPADATIASHKLLIQAGFIRESVAGRYFFLPLGQRVMDKFVEVVEEEMAAIDSQKMLIPILQPIELWEETNRNKSGGYELMKVEDRRGGLFTPGGTGEEMFTDIVRKFQISYKDLPISLYQFGYKFRDEMRAKGGLMRTREFLMKDAYVFTDGEDQFEEEYQKMVDAYTKIYERVGLTIDVVPADNGYFGGEYCHEFIQESPVGEGRYFVSEDGKYIAHEDIATFKREDVNPDEEIKEFEIFEQPDHVRTMEENVEFYGLPASHFLKNVVYKNRDTGQLIIATIRGDLSVNRNKLEHVLDMVGLLDDATDEDLEAIGTKSGYVHSWGYDEYDHVKFVGDISLRSVKNFIGGQKEETTDSRNVNYGRDFEHEITADIAMAEEGYLTEDGSSKLIAKKGVEVGNTFNLGYFYSDKMNNATFTTEDGKEEKYYMGSFGVGIARTVATAVEIHHDENGIIWPEEIAPYQVHLVSIAKSEDDESYAKAEQLYNELTEQGVEVLWDDRIEARPGEKFADADLIGIPNRVVVSSRSLENGGVEVKKRSESDSKVISIEEFKASLG